MPKELVKEKGELFSQNRYDFDPKILDKEDIKEIKGLVKEKRVDYGIAPIGTDIFSFIRQKEPNIFFEKEQFSNKLDALIYLPNPNKDLGFIILNSNQPLINQVFATAHEYYHYIKDLDEIRTNPRVCSLESMKNKNEQKASRFAAEFLLPDEALRINVEEWSGIFNMDWKKNDLIHWSIFCCKVAIRYCIPLKALLYRLCEEGYINDISKYLSNYAFIKRIFNELSIRYIDKAKELMDTKNIYVEEIMYDLIPKAYNCGYVGLETVEKDLAILGLEKDLLKQLEENDNIVEDEDINPKLKSKLLAKLNR